MTVRGSHKSLFVCTARNKDATLGHHPEMDPWSPARMLTMGHLLTVLAEEGGQQREDLLIVVDQPPCWLTDTIARRFALTEILAIGVTLEMV
jgi:hypothetical protein